MHFVFYTKKKKEHSTKIDIVIIPEEIKRNKTKMQE